MRSSLTVRGIGMELLLVPTTSLCACADDEVSSYLDKDGLIARRDELINEILATRMARMHSDEVSLTVSTYRSDHIRDAVARNRAIRRLSERSSFQ